ncbi:MAG: hypothetical protein ACI8V2_003235 [Candidatus Latescibacterota bacterium]|jgi:hypothetical protein
MNRFFKTLALTLLSVGVAGIALAIPPGGVQQRLTRIDNSTVIDINSISMFVTNQGSFAYDIPGGSSGLEFPKNTGKTAVFAAGLWLGGKVAGETRVAIAEYSNEFAPGIILPGGAPSDSQDERYRVYKISRGDDASNPDYAAWPVADGAPVNADGTPQVTGDQTLWAVYNDADANSHSNMQTAPLGIEVQQTTFAFNRTGALGNVVFLKFLMINKGGNQIDSTYVSIWSDPDLGEAGNDLVGADVITSMGYCYNGSNTDAVYGSNPPVVGYDFFKGPIGDDGVELPMTSFNKYINGTDPGTGEETYNYMKGLDADGGLADHTDPITGVIKSFMVDGDPVAGTGWNDENPADRRLMLSSGPFTFAPGDTQEVVCAVIMGQGQDRLTSITATRFFDTFAQSAFDANFELPTPPPAPKVTITALGDRAGNGKVALTWGTDSEVASGGDYTFEGYNVYQGESVAGPWRRISTYDLVNGSAIIFDSEFDSGSGVVINKPVQFGGDSGIRHYIELNDDKVLGGRLVTGKTYYYAVTAYSLNEGKSPKTLETALNVLNDGRTQPIAFSDEVELAPGILPRSSTAGSSFSQVSVDSIVQHSSGTSDGLVAVQVVDPGLVTGANYEVRFGDTDGTTLWNLVNLSTGQSVLSGMPQHADMAAAQSNPVVDGLLVRVTGPPLGMKDWDIPAGARWYTWAGADWGAEGFNGAITGDVANQWFGPTSVPPSNLVNIELRFTSVVEEDGENQYKPLDLNNANVSYGWRYLRGAGGAAPAPADQTSTVNTYDWSKYIINTEGPGAYVLQDRVPIMLSAWDTEKNRRLEVGFLENNQPGGLVNGAYGPAHNSISNTAGGGPREWLFIFDRDYTEPTDDSNFAELSQGLINDAPAPPIMYIVFAARRQAARFPQDGDSFSIAANHVNGTSDVFAFSTTGGILDDAELAKTDLTKVLAVPNPYLGRSSYELSSLARQMRFTNLPKNCMIRIFSLTGDLVRTISHTNNLSFETWDLKTDQGVLVASGVYVAHFDAPGIGTHFVKCAVFMEAETLTGY